MPKFLTRYHALCKGEKQQGFHGSHYSFKSHLHIGRTHRFAPTTSLPSLLTHETINIPFFLDFYINIAKLFNTGEKFNVKNH